MDFIRDFCRRWGVARLALMGSVITSKFRKKSDIDFLVKFAPRRRPRGLKFLDMLWELEDKFGREVHLVELDKVDNPYKRKHMQEHHEVIYESE